MQLSADHFNKLKAGRDRLVASGSAPTKEAHCIGPKEAEAVSLFIDMASVEYLILSIVLRGKGRCGLLLA